MATATSQARARRFLDTFVRSEYVSNWTSERTEAGGYAREGSDARDRHDRAYDAAEHGADGLTHADHIGDWRDALKAYPRDRKRKRWEEPYRFLAAVEMEIDKVEQWHEDNGSLFQEVG